MRCDDGEFEPGVSTLVLGRIRSLYNGEGQFSVSLDKVDTYGYVKHVEGKGALEDAGLKMLLNVLEYDEGGSVEASGKGAEAHKNYYEAKHRKYGNLNPVVNGSYVLGVWRSKDGHVLAVAK